MWLPLVLVICTAAPDARCSCSNNTGPTTATPYSVRSVTQGEVESTNFVVRSKDSRLAADTIARTAETLRAQAYLHWRESTPPNDWSPRCEIVIHGSRGSYTAAVGRGSEATFGSAWLDNRDRVCCSRRIDLLADKAGELSALPHELTHVIVSEMLGNRVPPRWLDEGIALLADSPEKQRLHERDFAAAQSRQTTFRAVELLSLDVYPTPNRVPAFYGQSRSLAAYLAGRGKPSLLITFAENAMDQGYDRALRDVYQIESIPALERDWLAQAGVPSIYQIAQKREL